MRLGAVWREADGRSRMLAPRVWRCERALERMRGLLGRPELQPGEGLLIDPCGSVHTFGMRYALDIVFLDEDVVTKLVRRLVPWRMAMSMNAGCTLEMAAGEIDRLSLNVGDSLTWKANA